jgi:hypothetical protein
VLPQDIQWRGTKSNLSHNFAPRLIAADGALLTETGYEAVAPYMDPAQARHLRNAVLAGSPEGLELATRLTIVSRWLEHPKRFRRAA